MQHLSENTEFLHFIHLKQSHLLQLKVPKVEVHHLGLGGTQRFSYIGLNLSFNSLNEASFQKWMSQEKLPDPLDFSQNHIYVFLGINHNPQRVLLRRKI